MPHVVVIGAGFAGLRAVRALRRAPVTVTLIDRHNFQTFQPLLYQVATAGLNVADVAFPIRGVTRRYENCSFRRGDVASIDHDRRVVRLPDGDTVAYDYLIVGAGARAAYFGVPGAEEHSFALYSLADATRLRNHILRCIELADSHPDLIERGLLTFVVVGAGPTGVEMAGGALRGVPGHRPEGLPEAARPHRTGDPRRDARRRAAGVPREVTRYALNALRTAAWTSDSARGRGGGAGRNGVRDGERIATSTVIWAAGVQTETLADVLEAERSRGGRVIVMPDLGVSGRPDVFVAGDMADALATDGRSLPQVVQVAVQSGGTPRRSHTTHQRTPGRAVRL